MTERTELHQKEQASGDFFDGWAAGYEDRRISPWFQYTQRLAIDCLELRPDSRVLDVGCGTGFAVRELAAKLAGGKACGIDISDGMVEPKSRIAGRLSNPAGSTTVSVNAYSPVKAGTKRMRSPPGAPSLPSSSRSPSRTGTSSPAGPECFRQR